MQIVGCRDTELKAGTVSIFDGVRVRMSSISPFVLQVDKAEGLQEPA